MQPGRARAACATCHARKVRCDVATVGFPCTNCRKAGRDDCEVHQKRRRVGSRSDFPIAMAGGPGQLPAISSANGRPWDGSPYGLDPAQGAQGTAVGATPILQNSLTGEQYRSQFVQFAEHPAINEQPVVGEESFTHVGSGVSNLNFFTPHGSTDGKFPVLHHPSRTMARRIAPREPERVPVEALQLPEVETVDRLIGAYFTHINPAFPVVDEARFLGQYHGHNPQNPPSLLLLQSILFAGAHAFYRETREREVMKAMFLRRAKMLVDAGFEHDTSVVVQSALLLGMYSDDTKDGVANPWFWNRYAAALAQELGMHRDAEHSMLPSNRKRLWRRLFWLLFRCDMELALQYGRPQAVHLDDCDVQPLHTGDFAECGSNTQVEYNVQLTELSIIISEVMRNRFRPRTTSEERRQAVIYGDNRLAQWTSSVPEKLQLRPLTLDIYATHLNLVYNSFLILLHRPLPQGQKEVEISSSTDANICSTAAAHVELLLESSRSRQLLTYLPSNSVNAAFTTLIELTVESRLADRKLASIAQRRYDSLLSSLRQLADTWPQAEPILHLFNPPLGSKAEVHNPFEDGQVNTAASQEPMLDPLLEAPPQIIEEITDQTSQNSTVAEVPDQSHADWRRLWPPGNLQSFHSGTQDWHGWQELYWCGDREGNFIPATSAGS